MSSRPYLPEVGRRIQLCYEYGWVKEGPSVQSGNWVAYRITPRGLAALDIFLIINGVIR